MHSPGKLLGIILFGIAITFCLTLCSFPEILTLGKTNSNHCHTEEEQEDDSEYYCCRTQAILPFGQNHYSSDAMHYWVHQIILPTHAGIFHHRSDLVWFPLIFDSLRVTVLRI